MADLIYETLKVQIEGDQITYLQENLPLIREHWPRIKFRVLRLICTFQYVHTFQFLFDNKLFIKYDLLESNPIFLGYSPESNNAFIRSVNLSATLVHFFTTKKFIEQNDLSEIQQRWCLFWSLISKNSLVQTVFFLNWNLNFPETIQSRIEDFVKWCGEMSNVSSPLQIYFLSMAQIKDARDMKSFAERYAQSL